MAKRAGKFGKVLCSGSELSVTSWKTKDMVGEADVTETTSLGKGESIGTIERIEFTLEANWNPATNPYKNPPNIQKGESGPAVNLYVNKDDAAATYVMPATFIADISTDVGVDAAVKYVITGKSNGTFTVNAN